MSRYFYDFAAATLGQPPAGWSGYITGLTTALEVETAGEDRVVRENGGADDCFAPDEVGSFTDGEVVARVSWDSTNQRPVVLWSRIQGANDDRYGIRLNRNQSKIQLFKTITGSTTVLAAAAVAYSEGPTEFNWLRLRVSGSTLSAKMWAAGDTEPAQWTVSATDTDLAGAGVWGIGSDSGTTNRWDTVGYATAGETAPTAAGDLNSPPEANAGADSTAEVGTAFSHPVSCTDPDGDTCTLTASNLPSWATFTDNGDNTGSVSGTPDVAGATTITIIATDPSGAQDTDSFVVTVSDTGAEPAAAFYRYDRGEDTLSPVWLHRPSDAVT